MDTKKIMLLLDVVKIGSLKRAAEALNYTQSGLIYQINSLEQEIGVPLLVRNHRGVSLTAAGAALVFLAERIAHVGPVDHALALNARVAHAYGHDHGYRPDGVGGTVVVVGALSALVLGKVERGAERFVGIEVPRAPEHGAALQP